MLYRAHAQLINFTTQVMNNQLNIFKEQFKKWQSHNQFPANLDLCVNALAQHAVCTCTRLQSIIPCLITMPNCSLMWKLSHVVKINE